MVSTPPSVESGGDTHERASRSATAAIVVAVVLAGIVGLIVATARFGIGLTPDSVVYLTGARSIADGDGYTTLGGNAIAAWPPGYSAMLAVGDALGLDPVDGAVVLSALALAATVGLSALLVRRHVESRGIQIAAVVVVACSAVLLEIFAKALSEHPFIPIVLAFILVCELLMEQPTSTGLFAAAVLCCWAAVYARYAGLVTIVVGGLVLVIAGWRASQWASVLRAAVFGVAALSLPALWFLRNERATGNPTGPRESAASSIVENVRLAVNEFSQWLATQLAPPAVRALVMAAALALLAAVVVMFMRRGSYPDNWMRLAPLLLFVGVYVLYLVSTASVVAFAAINTRFLSPVFVPLVVVAAWSFEQVRYRLPSAGWRTALTVVGLAWVVLNVAWFAGRAVNFADKGAGGYATPRWQNSEIIDDVRALDFSAPSYSNNSEAIAHFTGQQSRGSIDRTAFASETGSNDLANFCRRLLSEGEAQLIWFAPGAAKHQHTLGELSDVAQLELVVERSDGAIYVMRPRDGATTACEVG